MTPTDVANMAADLLREAAIESLEEDSKYARMLNRHYETVRKEELMGGQAAYVWNFALTYHRDVVASITAGRTFPYSYDNPDGALRILWLTRDGTPDGQPINADPRNDGFYSDFAGPLTIPIIEDIDDPDNWNALFVTVMFTSLAMRVAHGITDKISALQEATQMRNNAIMAAYKSGAIWKFQRDFAGRSFAEARGDARMWWRSAATVNTG